MTAERTDDMPVEIYYDAESRALLAELSGDLDHCTARPMRTAIDTEIMKRLPLKLILDFENVPFMDSSGIGLLIGRYKLMNDLGGSMIAVNPRPEVKKIMELAGVRRLCPIVEQRRGSFVGGVKL
jgi:stage II sporulation protein AA (anti-sigma F factor antagonist)